jgi:hypothetical protein
MPRVIYSPTTGLDVSSSVQSSLLSSRTVVMANLYSFSNRVFWVYNGFNFCAFWSFTDFDVPISLDYLQLGATGAVKPSQLNSGAMLYLHGNSSSTAMNFVPKFPSVPQSIGPPSVGALNDGGFKHSGLKYEVGLAANDVDVTWFVDDAGDYFAFAGPYDPLINPPVGILPMKQAMTYYRAFDDCPFWIHRAIFSDFPANGGSLLGTTLLWRGYVRKAEAAADYLKITLGSLMQYVQDTQVPNQLIQPNARTNPFLPFPNAATALGPYPSAGLLTRVSAKTYTFTATGALTANQLQDCWVTFQPAPSYLNFAPQTGLPPESTPGFRIQSNTAASSGGAVNVTFYNPPIVPGNVQYVILYSPNSQTAGAPGFPYVPPPEQTAGF